MTLPGWNSVGTVSRIHGWFEIAGVVCLALLVVAEVFAYIYGHRKDDLVRVAERDAIKQASDEAKRNQGQYESRAEALQNSLVENSKKTEKLSVRTETAEKKVSELEKEQIPRSLSTEQIQSLVAMLLPYAGQKVSIACIMNDTEGKRFGGQFITVFKAAKWDCGDGVSQAVYTEDPIGIEITLSKVDYEAGKIPTIALLLDDRLAEFGFAKPKAMFINDAVPQGTIEFRIGRKLKK